MSDWQDRQHGRARVTTSAPLLDSLDEPDRHDAVSGPRIHPVLYVAGLVGSGLLLLLALAALDDLSTLHLPRGHDELLAHTRSSPARDHRVESLQPVESDGLAQKTRFKPSITSWRSVATAFGGFSSTTIYSPQLNATWLARPAGFGNRIINEQGLAGNLAYMNYDGPTESANLVIADSHIDLQGCQRVATLSPYGSTAGLRTALIERGDCPFITKLLNAQDQGFSAVIVYNDEAHARHQHNTDSLEDDEDELISMWSPSRLAGSIEIPSVFVSRSTGLQLRSLMATNTGDNEQTVVVIEPETEPQVLLMDIIVALFLLPTIFTVVTLITTRIRQLKRRAKQRAPQSLVDSLPSFRWREGLDLGVGNLATAEKVGTAGPGESGISVASTTSAAGLEPKVASFLSRVLRRPAPAGQGTAARYTVIPGPKARQIAKKIFQQRECAICLGDFVEDDQVRLLPCGHIFHQTEIDLWLLEQKRWCPVCRFPVDGTDEEAAISSSTVRPARLSSPEPLEPPSGDSLPHIAAQPIITPQDIEEVIQSEDQPAASSSMSHERTPLLRTL